MTHQEISAEVMRAAHGAAKRLWESMGFDNYHHAFKFYLKQKWALARNKLRAMKAQNAPAKIIHEGTPAYREFATDGRI